MLSRAGALLSLVAPSKASVAGLVACVLMLQACATGQTTRNEYPRGAVTGQERQIGYWYSVAPDCAPSGDPEIRVLTPPRHGTIRLERGENFPTFQKENVRYACNTSRVPVVFVYYRSVQGFVGPDKAVLEILFPDGTLRTVTYTIKVLPLRKGEP